MLRSALSFAPSLALLFGCFGFGLASSSYGKAITFAPSLKEAAPLAAPFLLCASGAAASFALSVVALADRPKARRSRSL